MKVIAYYRVSTSMQGESRLGLEGQQKTVEEWARAHNAEIVATYTEIESGRKCNRPQLAMAIKVAGRIKATVVVARLDRLARNARFLLGLVESPVDFVFCDLPNVPPGATGKFLLSMMASVAEMEAGLTSERTKSALAAYKARGGTLGGHRPGSATACPETRLRASQAGSRARRQAALEEYRQEYGIIARMRTDGKSFAKIAEHLNLEGFTTSGGKKWDKSTVFKVLKRGNEALR